MIETDKLVSAQHNDDSEEVRFEQNLRPTTLLEYIGQPHVHEQLEVFVAAARKRQEPLDHVLLFGPPGLGKTTLAHVISHELETNLRQTSGPVLERAGDLAAILTNLQPNDVLFIDEIHRLNPAVEEILYPAMEDYQIDIIIGEGPAARSIKLDIPPFTLIGATTRAGLLTSPLRDRFGIVLRLEFYDDADLAKIVKRSAGILGIKAEPAGIKALSGRSRGTPRIANRLLRRARDYAEIKGKGVLTGEMAKAALKMLNVDEQGLDALDRRFLQILIEKFQGGPTGIDSLAVAISEERGTIEDIIEPFLIQQGLIVRTSRGRLATPNAWRHLGLQAPEKQDSLQQEIFQND